MDKEIEITSDFECGNCEHIRRMDRNHFSMVTRADWGAGDPLNMSSWYFCVKAKNNSSVFKLLKLDIHAKLRTREAYVWVKRGEEWNSVSAEVASASNDDWIIRTMVEVNSDQTVYVSNSFWYPPSEMMNWLNNVAKEKPGLCTLGSIGQTAQGRSIPVLTISDPSMVCEKERILVTASPQPSEMGDWACRKIIERLLQNDVFAKRVRKRWTVDIIPQTNPDGEALGTVMVNSLGQNPMFEFEEVACGKEGSAEATSLWNWIEKNRPVMHIEYHSYYQADRPSFRPYLFSPRLYHSERRRAIDGTLSQNLLSISTGPPVVVEVGNKPFCRSLSYQLIQKFDIISHLYKLHTRESLDCNLNQATRVFETAIDTLEKFQNSL